MNKDLFFSSKTDLWATPAGFFADLDAEFHFNLDPCATPENAKCKRYFTVEQDGLKQDWGGMKVFCNPPYGRTVGEWGQKGIRGIEKAGNARRLPTSRANRYAVVSRLHYRERKNPICARAAEIRRRESTRAVPVDGRNF
mgnify:CR=1 FL=1